MYMLILETNYYTEVDLPLEEGQSYWFVLRWQGSLESKYYCGFTSDYLSDAQLHAINENPGIVNWKMVKI